MAGALRRVSQNYNWTIKRADNDLHNVIHSQPQTHASVEPVDVPLVSWDPNRLRWKFGTEYEELREHLEHSFLILLTWVVTGLHLLLLGTGYTITNPKRSVLRIKQLALAKLPTSMSIWDLWVALVRSTASLILALLRGVFDRSLSLEIKAGIRNLNKTGARVVSWLVGQHNSAQVDAANASSDFAPSQPAALLANSLKDEIETIHAIIQDTVAQLSRRKTPR